ncbi:MAG: DUF1367 family protein [Gammaproteobacteria bacterium]|nr:DUF1367 family protein [Gammaproteobacteria bacterium]
MPTIYLDKISGILVPATEEDEEKLKKLPKDHTFKMDFTLKHNYAFHKKVFSFLLEAFQMQEHFDKFDDFRKWLIMKSGHFTTITCPNNYVIYEADSLDYENMDDIKKDKALKDMVQTFLDWRCNELNREDYEKIFHFGD